jgi:tetratricopeptide (TPR) repeat protein
LTGAGGIYPYSSPPFPARPSEPLFVLPPGVKRVLFAVAAAIAIGAVAGFGVIGFMNRYAAFEVNARTQQVAALVSQAEAAYNAGDFAKAAKTLEQALKADPDPTYRARIQTELGYTYVCLARAARTAGDTAGARADYEKALLYSPNYDVAHTELAVLLESLGDHIDAQTQQSMVVGGQGSAPPQKLDSNTVTLPNSSSGGGSTPMNGSGKNPDQFLQDRRQEAHELIREGDQLDLQGDHNGAEAKWSEAVEKGAGSSEADTARARLEQGSPGMPNSP